MRTSDGQSRGKAWLGNYGERVAAAWLKSSGHVVLAKNYRGPHKGEVDIIARKDKLLLFVEVKTRVRGSKVRGLDAVGPEKQALIQRGADAYLKRLGNRDIPWTFDVIEVTVEDGKRPEVNHIHNAF